MSLRYFEYLFEKQQITIRDSSNQKSEVKIFVEGGLKITPSNPFLNSGESIELKALRGTGNYSWSSEKGTLSSSSGESVIYTAPQIPTEDKITLSDNSGSETVAIIIVDEADTKTLNLIEGWNLASLLVDKTSSINIFNNFKTIWTFENNRWMKNPETIKVGQGFWIKMNSENSITFEGDNYVTDLTNLNSGWNLLGTGKRLSNIKESFSFKEE